MGKISSEFKQEFGFRPVTVTVAASTAAAILIIFVVGAISIGFSVMMTAGERAVLVNSHQYKEGMIDRARTWEAELAGIEQRLSGQLDETTRKNLEAQRAVLNVQLQSARRD